MKSERWDIFRLLEIRRLLESQMKNGTSDVAIEILLDCFPENSSEAFELIDFTRLTDVEKENLKSILTEYVENN